MQLQLPFPESFKTGFPVEPVLPVAAFVVPLEPVLPVAPVDPVAPVCPPQVVPSTEKEKTGANPEKASIHNKRIVIMKEPDGNEPIRNDRVKDITGGGNISGRMCFSNNTNINLNLILIMECNERPKFKSEANPRRGRENN